MNYVFLSGPTAQQSLSLNLNITATEIDSVSAFGLNHLQWHWPVQL
jgi:hypothetical protein